MTLRTNVILLVMMAMTALPAAAQRPEALNGEQESARRELRDVLVTWAKQDVLPKAIAWKRTLDGAMSADDLDALNRLRARASALRVEFIATALEMRKAWQDEDYAALKTGRARMKEFAEARNVIFGELKPLAIKYRSTLESIGAEAKPQMQEWKAERKKIVVGWIDAHKSQLGEAPFHGGYGKSFGGNPGFWKMNEETRKKVMVARFMLWDGGEPPYADEEDVDGLPELD